MRSLLTYTFYSVAIFLIIISTKTYAVGNKPLSGFNSCCILMFLLQILGHSCGDGYIMCDDQRTCIDPAERCDGTNQCPDGSDEASKYCGMLCKVRKVRRSGIDTTWYHT